MVQPLDLVASVKYLVRGQSTPLWYTTIIKLKGDASEVSCSRRNVGPGGSHQDKPALHSAFDEDNCNNRIYIDDNGHGEEEDNVVHIDINGIDVDAYSGKADPREIVSDRRDSDQNNVNSNALPFSNLPF